MGHYYVFLCFLFAICCFFVSEAGNNRTFVVDDNCKCFMKDGKPFRYISGSLHYFRIPREYWQDRMLKYKSAGLNAIQIYVEWSTHEPFPGVYEFEGMNDIVAFIELAQKLDLLVILRPGPYICAERDFGGFPFWLLRDKPSIALRTDDPYYLKAVDNWYGILLPKLQHLLYQNGGPIITVQVENEYGEFPACNFKYMNHLKHLIQSHLGNQVPLFATDIPLPLVLRCDNIDGIFLTLDFGSDSIVSVSFDLLRIFKSNNPLVVTEYYPGWLDNWGKPHANVDTGKIVTKLTEILNFNASINFYMFHGGTNFAFKNGANVPYSPQPTSYDYTAPINEAGDTTPRFDAIRKLLLKYVPNPPDPPKPAPKLKLGPLTMTPLSSIYQSLPALNPSKFSSLYPLTFEAMSLDYGFALYETNVEFMTHDPALLYVPGLRDRGYVFIDKHPVGILYRENNLNSMPIKIDPNQKLSILVENQGRINSAPVLKEFKGIIANVTLDKKILSNWRHYTFPLNDTKLIHGLKKSPAVQIPSFFSTNFTVEQQYDTYLDVTGWNKGVAFLNGHNLGRYWPSLGPQITLYVPGVWLNLAPQLNTLTLFELEGAPSDCGVKQLFPSKELNNIGCTIQFTNIPNLNGTVPDL